MIYIFGISAETRDECAKRIDNNRHLISGFCKLFLGDFIPYQCAKYVFNHYDYDEVINILTIYKM